MVNKKDKTIEELLGARKRNFPYIPLAILLLVITIGFILYFDLFNLTNSSEVNLEIKKELIVAEKGNMATTLTSSGTAKAGSQSSIYSSSSGEIREVIFEVGDSVKEGDVLFVFDDELAVRNLESSKSSLEQAKITLNELLENPTKSQILNAKQSTSNAEGQLLQAQSNYDLLITPEASTINSLSSSVIQAQSSIVSAQANIVSAQNTLDNAFIDLLNAQRDYCDSVLTDPVFTDEKVPICTEADIPLSTENKASLLDDIQRNNEPTALRISTTQALMLKNSGYTNAQSSLLTMNNNLLTAESNLLAAQANLEAAKNPSVTNISQNQSAIDTAKAALDFAIENEKDVMAGPTEFQINKQKQVVYSAELAVEGYQDQIDSLSILAPRDGVIGSMTVSVGDKVAASSILGIISDISSISIDLAISESDIGGIEEGLYGIAMFDSLPEDPYVVSITKVSIIPNITQGIVSYPVEAEILKARDIALALPELSKYTSGLSGSSDIASFLLPSSTDSTDERQRGGFGGGFDVSNLDIDCLQKSLGEDFDMSDIGPETFQKVRDSGCLPGSPQGMTGGASMLSLIDQFIPSQMPAAGMGANVIFLKDLKENLILVPSKTIRRDGRTTYVMKGNMETEEKIEVKLGESDGERTSIVSGVNEGDVLIIETKVAVDKESVLSEFKEGENSSSKGGPRPPKSSGFKGDAGN